MTIKKNLWDLFIKQERQKEYMIDLEDYLSKEIAMGKIIYPEEKKIFQAFKETPFEKTKVVIIGQDPYHGEGQAHGLSFSVQPGAKIPPSLRNIYKEIESDLGVVQGSSGNLLSWANQGVLLLNSVLTVEKSSAGSHRKKGWEVFTDRVIDQLNEHGDDLVFLLWGSPAQKKGSHIDEKKHLVLKSVHPSPLSAYRGFLGCKHFSQTNDYLKSKGRQPIDWSVK